MKVCVLIPLYNEARTIERLVKDAVKYADKCLVVDDGSADSSGTIALEAGAVVIKHSKNYGKGISLQNGFKKVLEEKYDAVITMDGDGQHDPADLPKFIKKAENSPAGIISGNRMGNLKEMPLIRILTNKLMSFVISKVSGQNIVDSQCGYRLIKSNVLEKLNLSTSRFEIESEILIETAKLGYRIDFVPINSIYRGEKSRIDPLFDTLRFIKFIFRRR
ncbi:MAG: glycosyltransferase family 2 protein [Candidatus Omnitrophota bacterium]|nr:glycosyltransferase family 2 protein [Candidatus Omnitrophota bacterium]